MSNSSHLPTEYNLSTIYLSEPARGNALEMIEAHEKLMKALSLLQALHFNREITTEGFTALRESLRPIADYFRACEKSSTALAAELDAKYQKSKDSAEDPSGDIFAQLQAYSSKFRNLEDRCNSLESYDRDLAKRLTALESKFESCNGELVTARDFNVFGRMNVLEGKAAELADRVEELASSIVTVDSKLYDKVGSATHEGLVIGLNKLTDRVAVLEQNYVTAISTASTSVETLDGRLEARIKHGEKLIHLQVDALRSKISSVESEMSESFSAVKTGNKTRDVAIRVQHERLGLLETQVAELDQAASKLAELGRTIASLKTELAGLTSDPIDTHLMHNQLNIIEKQNLKIDLLSTYRSPDRSR